MTANAEKLREEIERLEKELETKHFSGLFDQKGQHHQLKRLKKLRRQLAELEGTAVPVSTPVRKPQPEPKPAVGTTARKPAAYAPETSQAGARRSTAGAKKPAARKKSPPAGKPAGRSTGSATRTTKSKPAPTPASKRAGKK